MALILKQNTDLSDKIATPSEKLKKDPIMALVTRTISTYMLVKHSKNGKEESTPENLSPWGNPFFNKQDNPAKYKHKTRMARSPKSSATAKEEILNGSYESWRRHHSRFKQFARWRRRSTFSRTRPRKINKLKSTKASTTGKIFPKRRSESENYNQQSESYDRYKRIKSEDDIKSENKDIKVKIEEKLKT